MGSHLTARYYPKYTLISLQKATSLLKIVLVLLYHTTLVNVAEELSTKMDRNVLSILLLLDHLKAFEDSNFHTIFFRI